MTCHPGRVKRPRASVSSIAVTDAPRESTFADASDLAAFLIDAINRRDTTAAMSVLHDEIVLTPLVVRTGLAPDSFRGHQQARDYLDHIPALWGELHMAVHSVHEAGGMFVAFCEAQAGTGPPLPVTYVGRIKAAKVLELAAFADLDRARDALGAPPDGASLPPIEVAFPAVPDSVPAARAAMSAFLAANHVPEPIRQRVALAATEAMTNVVVHAYRHSDAVGNMTLRGEIGSDGLLVSVADEGCGLRPRPDSPGIGLGIALMSHEAAALTFVVPPERAAGTEVRLRFPLPD